MTSQLDPQIADLFQHNPHNIAAFRHAVLFNPYQSPYITKEEHISLAQSIVDEYAGYLIAPYEIYYHVQEYVIKKGHPIPYPHYRQYMPRPRKLRPTHMFAELLNEVNEITPYPSETPLQRRTHINKTITELFDDGDITTITGEQYKPTQSYSKTSNPFDELEQPTTSEKVMQSLPERQTPAASEKVMQPETSKPPLKNKFANLFKKSPSGEKTITSSPLSKFGRNPFKR